MIILYSPERKKIYHNVPQLVGDFPDIVYEEGAKKLLPEGHPPFVYPLKTNSIDTAYDKETQRKGVTDIQAVNNDDGEVAYYYRDEVIFDLSQEEIDAKKLKQAKIEKSISHHVRAERDKRLTESDWVATRAFETGLSVPTEWAEYRQALRDITKQSTFPGSIVWPTKPE